MISYNILVPFGTRCPVVIGPLGGYLTNMSNMSYLEDGCIGHRYPICSIIRNLVYLSERNVDIYHQRKHDGLYLVFIVSDPEYIALVAHRGLLPPYRVHPVTLEVREVL